MRERRGRPILAPAGSTIELAYGRGRLPITLPVAADVIRPRYPTPLDTPVDAVRTALRRPAGGPPLADVVPGRARVGISICDVTRPFPSKLVLSILLDEIPKAMVTLFVATGTHRACTDAELDAMLGPAIRSRVDVIQHDAFDAAIHTPLGPVPGSDVVAAVDSRFLDQDVRITLGFIEPHFFAGFSGGPKMVAPGLASIETVMELHSAARLADRRATFGVLEGNPVHDGIAAIGALADVQFAFDVALDGDQRLAGVFAGSAFDVHRQACEVVRETSMTAVDEAYDVVVTTNSGYPLDQNLYQGGKGLSAAANILRDGGEILFAAACQDGIPAGSPYARSLDRFDDPNDYLAALLDGSVREPEQWAGQKAAMVRERAKVVVRSDGLSDNEIRAAWFEPTKDASTALAAMVTSAGPGSRLAILPDGPQSIAYVQDGPILM